MTRGSGLLEGWLANLRARKANQLIPAKLRDGRILDIGCGSYPYFLSHTYFREKFAMDQLLLTNIPPDITTLQVDLNNVRSLSIENEYFSVVTMLAVIEHLDPDGLVGLFSEIFRILTPGGALIITTPNAWTDPILKIMAQLNLVSEEEINEHIFAYTLPLLGWYFGRGGFDLKKISFGTFEAGINLWALARK